MSSKVDTDRQKVNSNSIPIKNHNSSKQPKCRRKTLKKIFNSKYRISQRPTQPNPTKNARTNSTLWRKPQNLDFQIRRRKIPNTTSNFKLRTKNKVIFDIKKKKKITVKISSKGSREVDVFRSGPRHWWAQKQGFSLFVITQKSNNFNETNRNGSGDSPLLLPLLLATSKQLKKLIKENWKMSELR